MHEEAIPQYRILVRRDEEALRQCSALVVRKMDISSGKRWRTEVKVSILLGSELSPSIPFLRAFQGHSGSTINPALQDRRCYRENLSRRKRKRIEVNSGSCFDSRRSQSQNRQTSCVLHCCESDG